MRLGPAIEAQKRELSRASKYANTAITAIDTVKTFNGQDHEVWQYYSTIKQAAGDYLVQARANALQFGVTKFMMVAIFVQGFWYGISLANKGLDPGNVVTTFYACLSAMQAVEIVLPQWLVLTKGMSAGETLKSIRVQLKPGRKGTIMDGSVKPTSCPGDIEVNRVGPSTNIVISTNENLGIICIPFEPTAECIKQHEFLLPIRRNNICCWKERIWKEYIGKSHHEIL